MTKKLPATTTANLPAAIPDYINAADAGAGLEGAGAEAFAIPFLTVLQKISPQVDEADAKYVDGAKGGMLLNTVSNALYDGKTGVEFIPCAYQRKFIRWGPRGSNGGFKGEYAPELVDEMHQRGQLVELDNRLLMPLPDGTVDAKKCDYFADTRNHFGLLVTPDGASQVLLSLTSTQIKKSKQMNSMVRQRRINGAPAPSFACKFKLGTIQEANDKGTWYGLSLEDAGWATAEEYATGREFWQACQQGVKVNYAADAPEASDKF